jgi:hypothetical protein
MKQMCRTQFWGLKDGENTLFTEVAKYFKAWKSTHTILMVKLVHNIPGRLYSKYNSKETTSEDEEFQ